MSTSDAPLDADTRPLPSALFLSQSEAWPADGRVVLCHHDDETAWVYTRLTAKEAEQALAEQRMARGFELSRPRRVETHLPNIFEGRGWAAGAGDGHIAAVQVDRGFLDWLLDTGVSTVRDAERHPNEAAWKAVLAEAHVKVQWRPCRDPLGSPVGPQVPTFGLEREALRRFQRVEPRAIVDLKPFLEAQFESLRSGGLRGFELPVETVYRAEV